MNNCKFRFLLVLLLCLKNSLSTTIYCLKKTATATTTIIVRTAYNVELDLFSVVRHRKWLLADHYIHMKTYTLTRLRAYTTVTVE
ncbi:hypothetical protein F4813DRAFT_343488 [Daldinia decipiens]|uniref:uncharacterized protein n=1 Tax=Daldinia decipiens TaxID=326647 RepID=UPI0020C562F6|nr:uncharacterized protein F4813DRAFT_343488 [Daldinia decipiens]KAI1662109.1 hypothetical protein F4813DRAFT_343488 [Daldinia decipiens]